MDRHNLWWILCRMFFTPRETTGTERHAVLLLAMGFLVGFMVMRLIIAAAGIR